jgi:hypothetical protein
MCPGFLVLIVIVCSSLHVFVKQLPEYTGSVVCNLLGLFLKSKKFPEAIFTKPLYKPEEETECAKKQADGKCVGYPGIDVAELEDGQHNKIEHEVAKQYGNKSSLYALEFGCFINAFVESVHTCWI